MKAEKVVYPLGCVWRMTVWSGTVEPGAARHVLGCAAAAMSPRHEGQGRQSKSEVTPALPRFLPLTFPKSGPGLMPLPALVCAAPVTVPVLCCECSRSSLQSVPSATLPGS